MSRVLRIPVFLWRTRSDVWAGRVLDLDYPGGATCGPSPAAVLREFKDWLAAIDRGSNPFLLSIDFEEPEVRQIKLNAVPEYAMTLTQPAAGSRSQPCAEPVALKLPCVIGKREYGSLCAVLPTLEESFELPDGAHLEEMAAHYARQALKGLTPARLLRLLPALEWRLETISFTPRRRHDSEFSEVKLEALPKVAEPVTSAALRKVSRAWEREPEASALAARLRQQSGSVLLLGESGCGKTAVLADAARRVEQESAVSGKKPARFWMTSGTRLIAGMRWLGQWQERVEEVIADIRRVDGVLCFENLQELLRLGGGKAESSVAAFLLPYLQSGELRAVVETTPAEVDACERSLPGFLDAFSIQRVDPLAPALQDKVLLRAAGPLNSRADAFSADAALEAGRLCRRFQPYAGFPGAPLNLMREAAAQARESSDATVSSTALRRLFAETTGLPLALLDESAPLDPQALRAWFQERLIAQPASVEAVCRLLVKFKTGLNDPSRPLAVLLFTGPTGTGKTQLAKLLGDWLFPNRAAADRLVRLDMSEYGGHDATRRLLGEPFGEPSELVKKLRRNPFTVLLLDEVEKAAPEVFDTFMNVFDEGRLTDALGRVTWFRSTVIIMTSNLGARRSGALGFSDAGPAQAARSDEGAIQSFFRPEFFNRIDQVIAFDPLDRAAVAAIAERELAALMEREGLRERAITLEVDEALQCEIIDQGFDPVLGARPLQRKIEELLVTPLARWLVAHPATRDACLRVKRPSAPGDDWVTAG